MKIELKVPNTTPNVIANANGWMLLPPRKRMHNNTINVMNPLAKGTSAEINLKDSYTFYYDTYGNVIGVGDYTADANYVVIDRIWAGHDDGKVTVYADLVNVSDASVLSKVTVKSVKGTVLDVTVNQEASRNKDFYEDLMTYTVNKDGEYELTDTGVKVEVKNQDKTTTKLLCTYDANDKKDVIKTPGDHKNVYMDKDTEILFQYKTLDRKSVV